MRLLRLLVHLLAIRPLLWLGFGVNVRGREHLRGLSHFVLAANHNSHLDTLLLYAILPVSRLTDTHPVAARDYFGRSRAAYRLLDWLFRPVWVDRDEAPGRAVAEMDARLAAGGSLIVFPEGTRGEPGRLQAFRSGVGRLVERHRAVPVVPVFILGPERSLPRHASLPVPFWNQLTVGPPQLLGGTAHDATAALRAAIEDLSRSATAHRHRRPEARRPSRVVAVLGIDGSGKSTLARALAVALSRSEPAGLVSDTLALYAGGEPRPLQPLLAEKLRVWLGRQAKQAGSLARYKIPKLGEMLLRDRLLDESERWYGPAHLVVDGAPLLNLAAWAVLYRPECLDPELCGRVLELLAGRAPLRRDEPLRRLFPEARTLERLGLNRLRAPDAVICLDVAPATALARIAARGERRQVHENAAQLGRLREAYLLVCRAFAQRWERPVAVLDGEGAPDALLREALARLDGEKGKGEDHGG